jgi:hypothetical protein
VSEPHIQASSFPRIKTHSLFHCFVRTKGSVQARGTCVCFVTRPDLRRGLVSTCVGVKLGFSH